MYRVSFCFDRLAMTAERVGFQARYGAKTGADMAAGAIERAPNQSNPLPKGLRETLGLHSAPMMRRPVPPALTH